MSVPPEGGWQPLQQPGPPPDQGQPYGQQFNPSGYNPQQPPPPGWQHGPWPQQPGPPPQKGSSLKWLLIAVAVLLVIGISVGATLIFTRDGGGEGGTTATSGAPSDIASAGDTGAVSIITDEPTCKAFNGINNSLADVQKNGWPGDRAGLGPAAEWTPDDRTRVEAVAKSIRNAADQAVALAKQTPHRVVREVYEQFIAYGRAYADSVPNYVPADDALADVFISSGTTLIGICNSIDLGSASRSLTLDPAAPPTTLAIVQNPSKANRFLKEPDPNCAAWIQRLAQFNSDTQEWQKRDSSIPASQWTPAQRAVSEATQPLLTTYAVETEADGRRSSNPVFEDFAVTAALYLKAYVAAGENYVNADGWLSYTGFQIANLVSGACRAAAG
jgi:hypothetical protein